MNYLSLKYSESILAFQLQFGTYEAESEHFRSMGKRKTPFKRVVFKISRIFSKILALFQSLHFAFCWILAQSRE